MESSSPSKSISHPLLAAWYYYLMFPVMVTVGFFIGHFLKLQWGVIFLIFGIIPLLDKYWRTDSVNPTHDDIELLQSDWRFKMCMYLVIFIDWAIFLNMCTKMHLITPWTLLPTLFLASNLRSSAFLVAHELIHKTPILDRTVGTIHLLKNLYMHFSLQHVYGHHRRVATPEDPASAPKGMSFYEFLPRTLIGGFKSAWQINPKFTGLTVVASIAFLAVVYKTYGLKVLIMTTAISFGGICYLELTNYIEHYGLQRKRLPDGTYEKVTIRHSWNAAHRMSNYLLFKLQRHSDHHQNSLKSYQTLCTYDDSPQLPHGYLVCSHLALFPKTWFSIMDPLVEEYNLNKGKGTQLKALEVAVEKTDRFVVWCTCLTFIALLVQIYIRKFLFA